ncbi:hypothetical protein [Rhodoferax antarcticus]|nr:hypothetical protein [Rhodoferax antarcticus]MCW2311823.1 hypothetical protein [Rhodoferax antarcticus]
MPTCKMLSIKKVCCLAIGLIVAQLSCAATAKQPAPGFMAELARDKVLSWQFSPYTHHFSDNPEHKTVVLVGLEREYANQKLDGLALFSNSFGQPTVYLYPWGGVYKSILGVERLSFKWTAGLLYGYREPYEDKVPLNYKGFSPAVIPALAYEFKHGWSAQVNVLGTAGLMFQLSAPFK